MAEAHAPAVAQLALDSSGASAGARTGRVEFYYDLTHPECWLAAERIAVALPFVPEFVPVLGRALAIESPTGDREALAAPASERRRPGCGSCPQSAPPGGCFRAGQASSRRPTRLAVRWRRADGEGKPRLRADRLPWRVAVAGRRGPPRPDRGGLDRRRRGGAFLGAPGADGDAPLARASR